MKKSDLKSGMVVKLREYDELYILIGDVFCSYNGKAFISLNKYDDELRYTFYIDEKEMDITEVYKCKYPNVMSCFIEGKLELIWEREKEINWSKVLTGTKVFVRDSLSEDWRESIFIDENEEGKFITYDRDNHYESHWNYCKLIEEPEEEKEEKEELTLEILHQEYLKYCEAFIVNDDCCDCKYIDNRHGCFSSFILKNYNVTRK